jgi:beta-lactamase regulating signal transducer with metallopeptidase domain
MEHLLLNIHQLLLWSLVKWMVLFTVVFLYLTIHKKLTSDMRHVILLLLIYAVVLIPFADAVFSLNLFGDTPLPRRGREIIEAVNITLKLGYMEEPAKEVTPVCTNCQSLDSYPSPIGVSWPVLLFTVWVTGIMATSTGLIIGRCRVCIIYRRYCDQPTGKRIHEFEHLVKKLGIRRRVELVISRTYRIPYTFRIYHPIVVLPKTSEHWSSERINTVLLHELSHIRRGDYLSKLLARLFCSLFWFLPFIWIAHSRLTREQEIACDLSVLQRGVRPTVYAQQILDIATISIKQLSFQGAFLAEGRKKTLERRIIHALQYDKGSNVRMGKSKKKTIKCLLAYTLVVLAIVILSSNTSPRKSINEKEFIAAVVKGNTVEAETLIQSGADVDAKSRTGKTALMYAAILGHPDIVGILLKSGADVNAISWDTGDTALTFAAWLGYTQIANYLLDAGADVNVVDPGGETALTIAAWNGHTETVELLLDAGADVNTRNNVGMTALKMARSKNNIKMESLLRDAGAKE